MEEIIQLANIGAIEVNHLEDAMLLNFLQPQPDLDQRLYKQSGRLNLETLSDDEIKWNFRFTREDLQRLKTALLIPDIVRTQQRHVASGLEALCICLRRLAYPNRLSDLENMFGLSGVTICNIVKTVINHIHDRFSRRLTDLSNLEWLTLERMEYYSQAIQQKNAPLRNCWGFIDGTARAICRPGVGQEEYFSGHKRLHCVKYQSVLCPDGIIVSLLGPFHGRRHDAGILRESGFYEQLESCCKFPTERNFVLYGDPSYGIRELLISPHRQGRLTPQQQHFNTAMSAVRQSVEWGFQKIATQFAFIDFKKNQKILLQDIGKMYQTCTVLTNCHTCLYKSQSNYYFNTEPPTLEQYLGI